MFYRAIQFDEPVTSPDGWEPEWAAAIDYGAGVYADSKTLGERVYLIELESEWAISLMLTALAKELTTKFQTVDVTVEQITEVIGESREFRPVFTGLDGSTHLAKIGGTSPCGALPVIPSDFHHARPDLINCSLCQLSMKTLVAD